MRRLRIYVKIIWHRLLNYTVGMRTVKTALAVFACLLFFYFLERRGLATPQDAFLACVAAVISMKDNMRNSIKHGMNRLEGTFFGAIVGMAVLYVIQEIDGTPFDAEARMIATALGTLAMIVFCNLLKKNDAIIVSCVVFLFIVVVPLADSPIVVSLYRFADTALGILISIAVNRLIYNPDRPDEDENDA